MGLTQNLGRLSPSIFSDSSLNIGVGAAPSGSYKFEVTGTSKVSGVLTLGATLSNGTYTYTLPAATGTLALVGGAGVGTVTSVAALTIGTSGTDLSSTVANSTTTPVITLNVPTASATNRGALASADFTTFNNKQGTITLTTTGTSGVATLIANTLNVPNYGSALSGYLPLTGGTLTGNTFITDGSTFRTRLRADAARIDFVNYAESAFVGGFIEALTLNLNTLTNNPIATGTGTVTLGGALSGTSASFSTTITSGGNINSGDSVTLLGELYWGGTQSGQKTRAYTTGSSGSATLNYSFWTGSAWFIRATLDSNGAATFISSVTAVEFGASGGIYVAKNGSNTQGSGPYFLLSNAGSSQLWYQQLNASNGIDYWYNGSVKFTIASTGAATFSSSVQVGSTGGGLVLSTANSGTAAIYQSFTNSGGTSYLGSEASTGGTLITGDNGYDFVIRGASGITFSANNGASPNMRITSGGNVQIGSATSVSATSKLQVINSGTQNLQYTSSGSIECYAPEGNASYVRFGSAYNLNGVYAGGNFNYIIEPSNSHIFRSQTTSLLTIASTGEVKLTSGISNRRLFAYDGGSANANGLGLDMAGFSYEYSLFFAYGTSDNGRTTIGSYDGTTYRTKMTILGNGNVLIGTTTDDTVNKLQVTGSIKISQNLTQGSLKSFNSGGGITVSTSAITIQTTDQNGGGNTGNFTIVSGVQIGNGGIAFVDLVLWMYAGVAPTVISSQITGAAVARVYTISSSANLQLTMASNSYSVSSNNFRQSYTL